MDLYLLAKANDRVAVNILNVVGDLYDGCYLIRV